VTRTDRPAILMKSTLMVSIPYECPCEAPLSEADAGTGRWCREWSIRILAQQYNQASTRVIARTGM